MRTSKCPKCGATYELHPLNPESQELCPACRNLASWADIRRELANAAKRHNVAVRAEATLSPRAQAPAGFVVRGEAASSLQPHGGSLAARSAFAPRGAAVAVLSRRNPFGGGNAGEVLLTGRPAVNTLDRPRFSGRIVLEAHKDDAPARPAAADLPVGNALPQLRDVPVANVSAQAEAGKGEQVQAASGFTLPVLGLSASGVLGAFAAAPVADSYATSLSLDIAPPKPAMLEMPNTCGG